jgi:hypothetical protein
MDLYTINPFETATIFHSEYCPGEITIARSARELLPAPPLNNIESVKEQLEETSLEVIIGKKLPVVDSALCIGDTPKREL